MTPVKKIVVDRLGVRLAEERTARMDAERTLERIRRLLGARPGYIVSAVQRILEARP